MSCAFDFEFQVLLLPINYFQNRTYLLLGSLARIAHEKTPAGEGRGFSLRFRVYIGKQ